MDSARCRRGSCKGPKNLRILDCVVETETAGTVALEAGIQVSVTARIGRDGPDLKQAVEKRTTVHRLVRYEQYSVGYEVGLGLARPAAMSASKSSSIRT